MIIQKIKGSGWNGKGKYRGFIDGFYFCNWTKEELIEKYGNNLTF